MTNVRNTWTKPGEVERSCQLRPWARASIERDERDCTRDIAWILEHVKLRDWYAVERIAKRLQQNDRQRAFDHIDLFNNDQG